MGKQGKQWQTLLWGAPKVTADGDYSHEIKRRLLLGRKTMTNLDIILKRKDITLPTKFHLVKAMVSPVVMCECESWTIKKFEHQRIDAFELYYWRRLLRVPWTARRSNQSILKEISLKYSLEGLMLKLKLQYSIWCKELTHLKRFQCWERSKARGEGYGRGWDGCMASPTWWTWVWASSGNWWCCHQQGSLACCSPWGLKESDSTEQLNWTELNPVLVPLYEPHFHLRVSRLLDLISSYTTLGSTTEVPTDSILLSQYFSV